jgi:tetratricopeptide (TPR) repeat protein
MNITYLVLLAACARPALLPAAVSLAAQGVPPGTRVTRSGVQAPRLMVANPFAFGAADSTAAVAVGSAARQSVQEMVGDDYNIVTRDQMNQALVEYGYPADAILNNSLAVTLAKNIGARIVVTSTLTKAQDGRYSVMARLSGLNDEAGHVSVVAQQPGERMPEFGYRIAEALQPVVKSLADARACMDQRETKAERAAKSAEKAIKRVPNHGLAHYCLFELAAQQKVPAQESVKYLEAAVKGDPFSVAAWRQLANIYDQAKDTANALRAWKQLLRIAPTNQRLRERIFRYFLHSGQPKLALEVAEEGLKIDPYNPELYDLRANACLFLNDFACAITALERKYATDSTKADTLFFVKMSAAATGGEVVDTARLLQWAQAGARKYPDNLTILGYLNQAYAMTGQIDSTVGVTRRIIAKDTTAVVPALAATQLLVKTNRTAETAPLIEFVKRYGNRTQKDQLAGMLSAPALARLQGDSAAGKAPDLAGAGELARLVVELADSAGQIYQFGNFVLGATLFRQAAELDPETERQKSCDMARQEQQLMADAKAALEKVQLPNYRGSTTQYLGYIKQFTPRVTDMLKRYCR